ncbi:hypothetical protein NDU88_011361 [Pleurodeles waltl]|uniref:Uncharacterized protein n=1 Tax=Pleurodeles waltl TaxID=8319 RepID=A0AAV7R1F2_PLEWA|nr:hypothetical protein NDU88_011361 [Pleurodeles waltl]
MESRETLQTASLDAAELRVLDSKHGAVASGAFGLQPGRPGGAATAVFGFPSVTQYSRFCSSERGNHLQLRIIAHSDCRDGNRKVILRWGWNAVFTLSVCPLTLAQPQAFGYFAVGVHQGGRVYLSKGRTVPGGWYGVGDKPGGDSLARERFWSRGAQRCISPAHRTHHADLTHTLLLRCLLGSLRHEAGSGRVSSREWLCPVTTEPKIGIALRTSDVKNISAKAERI